MNCSRMKGQTAVSDQGLIPMPEEELSLFVRLCIKGPGSFSDL